MKQWKLCVLALAIVGVLLPVLGISAKADAIQGLESHLARQWSTRDDVRVVDGDYGGNFVAYAQDLRRLRADRTLVVVDGPCASACTLLLSLEPDQICISPQGSFLFHRASGSTPEMNAWATELMMRLYPAWVRSWITQQGGLSEQFVSMDYHVASRFLRSCRVSRS
jgi:hypothetical protein